jgi:hypothetical protein
MTRYKTQAVATLAFALLTVPAFADDWAGNNGTSQNGLGLNSLTSNSLTSNGTGLYALNGVRVEGIVLAKSTGPAAKSVTGRNIRSLPAVQKGGVEKSIVDPNDRSRPAGKKSTAGKSVVDPND